MTPERNFYDIPKKNPVSAPVYLLRNKKSPVWERFTFNGEKRLMARQFHPSKTASYCLFKDICTYCAIKNLLFGKVLLLMEKNVLTFNGNFTLAKQQVIVCLRTFVESGYDLKE